MMHEKALNLINERVAELERVSKDYLRLIKEYQADIDGTSYQPKIDILQARVDSLGKSVVKTAEEVMDLCESAAHLALAQMQADSEWVKGGPA